jgi:uncharacterized protein
LTNVLSKNVLGTDLEVCSVDPMTGYFRNGYCNTGPADTGTHVVAAVITQDFLDFTASRGNDLQTPIPEYDFLGLKPGDGWCLCATRWLEAERAGVAPPINLKATHAKALEFIGLEKWKKYERRSLDIMAQAIALPRLFQH